MNSYSKKIFIILAFLSSMLGGIAIGRFALAPKIAQDPYAQIAEDIKLLSEAVLPQEGFKTKIALGDSVIRLVENGVIDLEKFENAYATRGGLTPEQKSMLTKPSDKPLSITADNAQFLVNILWPLGITNKNSTLEESEAGKPENLHNLASTGGWILAKTGDGGDYYNTAEIIKLTPEQDVLVKKVARNVYRPCCGNSTAFPDCNHGAAILGMLQLGATQGLSEQELYEEALKFNIFWFPDQYFKMAMLYKNVYKKPWNKADPKILLSEQYSSGYGFQQNVAAPLAKIPGLSAPHSGGESCGV